MRKLTITIILLFAIAYIIGQIPGDGVKVLFVAGVVGACAYGIGHKHGYRERVQTQARSDARLAEVKG